MSAKSSKKKTGARSCLLRDQLSGHALEQEVKPGKQGIQSTDRGRFVERTGAVTGSLDFDAAMRPGAPAECRWDYAIGVDVGGARHVDCAEVHPATSREVALLIRKKQWSKTKLEAAGAKVSAWHWITTDSGPGFRRGGSEEQRLRDAGILFPKRQLVV